MRRDRNTILLKNRQIQILTLAAYEYALTLDDSITKKSADVRKQIFRVLDEIDTQRQKNYKKGKQQ